jgi:hypothetical protein
VAVLLNIIPGQSYYILALTTQHIRKLEKSKYKFDNNPKPTTALTMATKSFQNEWDSDSKSPLNETDQLSKGISLSIPHALTPTSHFSLSHGWYKSQ